MKSHKRRFKAFIIEKTTILKFLLLILAICVLVSTYKYIKPFITISHESFFNFSIFSIESTLPDTKNQGTFERIGFIKLVAAKASGLDFFDSRQSAPIQSLSTPIPYTPVTASELKESYTAPIDVGNIKEKENNFSYNSVAVDNKTSFNIDIDNLLNAPLSIKNSENSPLVLVVHTHTTESYTPSEAYNYTPQSNWRTLDTNFNMIRVGEKFSETLSNCGINVLHDKSINDYPSYNGSYKKTLQIIEDYIKKYPSIQIVVDIHRDSITAADGTRYKVSTEVSNAKAAQVLLIVGTSEGGLSHPNWRENLKLGLKLQSKLNSTYSNIARPLSIRKERFNTHATIGSMLLEIGTDANTLDEALLSAEYSAKAFADVIKSEIK